MEPTAQEIEIEYPVEGSEPGIISLMAGDAGDIYLTITQAGFEITVDNTPENTAMIKEATGLDLGDQPSFSMFPTAILNRESSEALYLGLRTLLGNEQTEDDLPEF